jgi:transcriptional regulator with GAF, ATPase, and Fis domain
VRLVAATHVHLEEAVRRGRFREDLYYRVAVFPLHLVPLRERLEDLPELCRRVLEEIAPRIGRRGLRVSPRTLAALARWPFRGNIRELSNLLERAAITGRSATLEPADFGLAEPTGRAALPARAAPEDEPAALPSLAENERRHIQRVLAATGGRLYGKGGAAEILGLPPSTLQSRMKKLGVARVEA